MSELKATPGPWLLEPRFVYALNKHQLNRFSLIVSGGYDDEKSTSLEELEANASLIAAAPALYTLAERAMHWFAENQCAGDLAWEIGEALAKARGDLVDPLEQVRP